MLPKEANQLASCDLVGSNFDGALGDDFQFLVTAFDRKILGAIAEVVVASS